MRIAIVLAALVLTSCAASVGPEVLSGGPEAPDACGFPDGTALSYAGRSTTSELGVQEVVGDPMSDDPADIYITRDAFEQGALRGRLVCAIYVNQPGFVEITVHPADGGRARAEPDPTPEPLASDEVEITTHCGLDFARVEWEGQRWMFDVEDGASAPFGWGDPFQIIKILDGVNGPIAIGPDGSVWHLIPAVDDEAQLCM